MQKNLLRKESHWTYLVLRGIIKHDKQYTYLEKGIEKYMDIIVRGQEYNLRTMVAVYVGDVEKLVGIELKEENNLGMYLWENQKNAQAASGKLHISDLNFFLNNT